MLHAECLDIELRCLLKILGRSDTERNRRGEMDRTGRRRAGCVEDRLAWHADIRPL